MKYLNEIAMYPAVIEWLLRELQGKFGKKARRIQVRDTHDSDLSNFVVSLGYEKAFPEFSTYNIRQDITGFIEYSDTKVDLVFVECKLGRLRLLDLSQLIGYSCIALPIYSILLSPLGMGPTLSRLLLSFNRKDILEFRPNRHIHLVRWDAERGDIDYSNSIL